MKKQLLILLALTAVGAVFWRFWPNRELSEVQPAAVTEQSLDQLVAEDKAAEEKKPEEKIIDNKEVLKATALEIISRPIKVNAPLSEADRKRAEGKIKEASDLIIKDYDYVYPWYDLGAYRRVIGDFEGAAEAWNFVPLIRPEDFVAYHNLGDLYGFYMKDYPKSEENYLKSIQNNPQNIQAYLDLATIYGSVYKEKNNQVESILLLGLQVNPGNAGLQLALDRYNHKLE